MLHFVAVPFEYQLMKRLDQGHLHPKLEVLGLTCPSRNQTQASKVVGKHSRKGPFKQLVNSYTEHLHMSTRPVENTLDMAFPKHVLHEHA
jgi:hypothetical protein